MTEPVAATGGLLALAGAFLLYAGARHQQVRRARGRHGALLAAGGWCLAAALPLLLTWASTATAVFIWVTLAMLVCSVVPIVAAWRRNATMTGKSDAT